MLKTKSQKIVTSGLLLAIGILLPFITSHSIVIIPGNVILPMHIPVLLCGFFCGPMYGAILGFILPYLNSALTSMPVLYPMAIVMSGELLTYGFMTGYIHKLTGHSTKLWKTYLCLIVAMICGRIVYGIVGAILLGFNPNMQKLSVIGALISGIPGIIIQLALIPAIVSKVSKSIADNHNIKHNAIKLIDDGTKTLVVIKDNKITYAESPKGISETIKLYENGTLENAFVADAIIGKAAAMIFTASKTKACYGKTMSREALKWLNDHNVETTYSTLADYIINRKNDGMCPMEETVMNISNEKEAILLLKSKIEALKSRSKQEEQK